jgi:hypothetical protein
LARRAWLGQPPLVAVARVGVVRARSFATLIALAALALLGGACGSGDGGASSTTAGAAAKGPFDVRLLDPRRVVAIVGDQRITRARYDHFYLASRARGHTLSPATRRRQTMSYLITLLWIRGEARARAVTVTRSQLDAAVKNIRRRSFPEPGQYRAFLKRTKLTAADAREQIELNLLETRLARHVTRAITDARTRKRAKARYAKQLKARWRARTICASHFHAPECSNR